MEKPEEVIIPEVISGQKLVRQLLSEIKIINVSNKKSILEKSTILMSEWKKINKEQNRDVESLKRLMKEITDTFRDVFAKIILDLKNEATSLRSITVQDNFGQKLVDAASFYGELMKLGIFGSSI
jgi:hypothetical protein